MHTRSLRFTALTSFPQLEGSGFERLADQPRWCPTVGHGWMLLHPALAHLRVALMATPNLKE